MKEIDALEIAYKNGYEKGVQEAKGTARWVISTDGYYPYCSKCKHEPENGCISKFCPNCGKVMVENEG